MTAFESVDLPCTTGGTPGTGPGGRWGQRNMERHFGKPVAVWGGREYHEQHQRCQSRATE